MDGIVSEDSFTLPLVLLSANLNQPVSLVNCNGWQLEVAKDQSVPLLVLENGDFSIQNVSDLQNNFANEEVSIPKHQNDERLASFSKEDIVKQGKDRVTEVAHDPISGKPLRRTNENYLMDDLVETFIMYKCKLCTFKAVEKSLLADHIRNVHLKVGFKKKNLVSDSQDGNHFEDDEVSNSSLDRMVYTCGSCAEAFENFAECRIHMAQHHKIMMGSKPVKKIEDEIQQNGNEFYIKVNVKTDLKRSVDKEPNSNLKLEEAEKETNTSSDISKERNIKCPEPGCTIKFSSELGLARHKLCHCADSSKGYSCYYCNTSFNKWSMCANHLWKIHSVDAELYACTVCTYKTALSVKMKVHLRIHDEGKEFMCDECGKMFSQKCQLRNHKVTHMKSKPDQQPRWYKKKECCDQCQKTFANSKTLKKHVRTVHSKLKPYFCQVCGHSSATKSMLQTHLRQHTGEKPFSCPSCPFTTGDHNTLRRHRMRHSGERPYSCPHCPYSSIQSSSLKHHLSTWHPSKKQGTFKCEQCPFSAETQDLYTSHMASEHTETVTSTSDSECLFYGDMTASQFVYQCLQDYKDNNSSLQSNLVCSSSGDAVLSSREFCDGNQNSFPAESLGQEVITVPAGQEEKEMIIEIPISPDDMRYLKEHSLEAGGIGIPPEDIDSFQPVP